MKDTHFILFSTCVPVAGANRSVICDIQRSTFKFIPNALFEILNIHLDKSINKIKEFFENQHDEIIEGYFNFLLENEFGFIGCIEERKNFPKLDLSWKSPIEITNAIIDINSNSNFEFELIAQDLSTLGCRAIELRMYDLIEFENLKLILKCFEDTRIKTIYILMKYSDKILEEDLEVLCYNFQRVRKISFHSSPFEKNINFKTNFGSCSYFKSIIKSSDCCGKIGIKNFRVNMGLFTESHNFNSCLNRKVSIDMNGFIKNCPSSLKSFGRIQDGDRIIEAVTNNEFQKLWKITKDQISVCKDCEFRYICTDCRAFIQEDANILSKPLKCNYNPYTALWEN